LICFSEWEYLPVVLPKLMNIILKYFKFSTFPSVTRRVSYKKQERTSVYPRFLFLWLLVAHLVMFVVMMGIYYIVWKGNRLHYSEFLFVFLNKNIYL
jgi:hypothetical protein